LPEISGFYILHEGFLSVLDDQLIEEDYDDIQERSLLKLHKKDLLQFLINFGLHQSYLLKVKSLKQLLTIKISSELTTYLRKVLKLKQTVLLKKKFKL